MDPYALEETPGYVYERLITNDPEYRAVPVVKTIVILVIVRLLLIDEKVMRLEDVTIAQTADETEIAFIESRHPDTEDRLKAEGNVSLISKEELYDVIAFNCSEYCEVVDLAVLGETVEEVTVKLTCPNEATIRKATNIQQLISFMLLL